MDSDDIGAGEIKPTPDKNSQSQDDKIVSNVDILQIVEKNEKLNEAIPDKVIEQANQLLSFDNRFYNVKNKLMMYQDYPVIARKLH